MGNVKDQHRDNHYLRVYLFVCQPPEYLLLSEDTGDFHRSWTVRATGEGNAEGPEELAELYIVGCGSVADGLEKDHVGPPRWLYSLQSVHNDFQEVWEILVSDTLLLIHEKLFGHQWRPVAACEHLWSFVSEGNALLNERKLKGKTLISKSFREMLHERRTNVLEECVGGEPTDPLTLEPVKLPCIENCSCLLCAVEGKSLDEFLEREHFLSSSWIPSEEREEIHERLWKVSPCNILFDSNGILPLA